MGFFYFLDVQNDISHPYFSGPWVAANPGNFYCLSHIFVEQVI